MYSSLRGLLAAALLAAGLALIVAPASATKAPPPKGNSGIIDEAGLFSADAVKRARDRVEQIRNEYGKGLFIETIPTAEDKAAVRKMADRKYDEHKVGGVLVLICKGLGYQYVVLGKTTEKRAFTPANR